MSHVNQVLVAHTCNPNFLGAWDPEYCILKPAQANSTPYSISKITTAKWTGGAAQVVKCLLYKVKFWVQTPVPPKKKKTLHEENKTKLKHFWSKAFQTMYTQPVWKEKYI
jgi:hypothetical protein